MGCTVRLGLTKPRASWGGGSVSEELALQGEGWKEINPRVWWQELYTVVLGGGAACWLARPASFMSPSLPQKEKVAEE